MKNLLNDKILPVRGITVSMRLIVLMKLMKALGTLHTYLGADIAKPNMKLNY